MTGVDVDISASLPTKRQSLIPFPRVGKRDSLSSKVSLTSYWPKRDDFKRRITRRSYWDKDNRAFNRRILRSGEERSWPDTPPAHLLLKRQSLIPFPRTGKRSQGLSKEENQVYIFESPEEEEEENGKIGSVLAEADFDVDFEEDYEDEELELGSCLECYTQTLNKLHHHLSVYIHTTARMICVIEHDDMFLVDANYNDDIISLFQMTPSLHSTWSGTKSTRTKRMVMISRMRLATLANPTVVICAHIFILYYI